MQKAKSVHCWNCGKEMVRGKGVYEYDNKYLGRLSVPYAEGELLTCDCGEALYVSAALGARMSEYEQCAGRECFKIGPTPEAGLLLGSDLCYHYLRKV